MIGSRFGQFEITAKLGEGGMGVVYEAQDHDLGRKVALKILPAETAGDPHRLERFRREARAVAALNHPNIITIHGIETIADKQFLVMELVEGRSLEQLIGEEGLPLAQVFDMAIPLAEALGAAHSKGVVHRDVKPANVMLSADGQVKVLDFGLAKAATQSDPAEREATEAMTRTTPLTGEGVVVGTAPYMSPEQLQGYEVDARSDIFSLGVVLFEMVTGKRPFAGESRIALASSILKDTPDAISEVRADLPRHLGRIIHQCLEKEPERRFQTALDVRNQLASLRDEALSGAAPESAGKRSRVGRGLIIGALGLAAVALAVLAWRSLSPADPPAPSLATKRIVVLPFQNLGRPDDEYFADGMTDEITSRLGTLAGVAVISRASAMRYKHARPTLREIGAELGVDYVVDGTVRWQRTDDGASTVRVLPALIRIEEDETVWSEPYNAVLADIFEVQSDIARKVSDALGVTLFEPARASDDTRTTDNLEAYDAFLRANEYYNRGMETGHRAEILIATRLYDKTLTLDPGFALAHARRAIADVELFDSYADRSPERLARAKESSRRALELEPDLPESHLADGQLHLTEGRDREALAAFEIALTLSPTAETYLAMADAQQYLALWDEAEANAARAVELDPHAGEYACNAGGVNIYRRDYREALDLHERSLQLIPDRVCPYFCTANIFLNWDANTKKAREFLENLPPDLPLDDPPAINHPWIWLEMFEGDFDAALRRLESGDAEAYEFFQYYVPKDLIAARIHRLLGAAELAKTHYEAALSFLENRIAKHPEDTRPLGSLAVVYAALGRREDSLSLEQRVLELHEARPGLSVGYNFRSLAEMYLLLGDEGRAVRYIERMLNTPSFFSAAAIEADPMWRDLRDHPEFIAMLDRYGG